MALELLNLDAVYYPHRESIRFFAADGFGRVLCMVTVDALRKHFGLSEPTSSAAISIAENYRDDIERIARSKYEAGATEPEGGILIFASDFKDVSADAQYVHT